MQYMSEFGIAAVVGTVVLFALYFLKRNYDTPRIRSSSPPLCATR